MTWSLASRLVFGRRGLLGRRPAKVALISTALGVIAMVVAMALMSGYRGELEERLLLGGADLGVYTYSRVSEQDYERTVEAIQSLPGVKTVERVAYGQGTLLGSSQSRTRGQELGVTVRGVDPGSQFWGRTFELAGDDSAVLGAGLAAAAGLEPGDRARLMLMDTADGRPRFRYHSVDVVQVVRTGYHEFDNSWMVVRRGLLERLAGVGGSIEVSLAEESDIERARTVLAGLAGPSYEVRDFHAPNAALFAALAAQQVLLFLLLGLIVVVATANTASSLVVLIRERRRDLGVLTALGLDARALGRTLFESGLLLTLVGTSVGLAIGATAAWLLDAFEVIRLGEELSAVYFLSAVPFHLRAADLAGIALLAIVAGAVASAIPAARASHLNPTRSLRSE